MDKLLIADLFCGAGGSAMGIQRACERAGVPHRIVGFDIRPMPRYPFEFVRQDALTVDLSPFDAVWASPPCQYYSRLRHLPWLRNKVYWRSIPPTREWVQQSGKSYVIENVEDAKWDMRTPAILCGQALGLNLYRHRAFETWPFSVLQPGHQRHIGVIAPGRASLGKRHHGQQGYKEINRDSIAGHRAGLVAAQRTMGIDWMTRDELAQAIPPAYAEFVWSQMLTFLQQHRRTSLGPPATP